MSLNDFKKQLDTLSESLHQFDPVERSKALKILQECIQGLESKTTFSLTEDSYEDVKNETSDTSHVKIGEYSSIGDSSEELNTLDEKTENEGSEKNLQSDEECESQSEEEWKSSLKCPKCEKEYDDKRSLLKHLQLYPGKLKSCIDCQKAFNNSIAFKFHKQRGMCLKSSKIYKCKLCNKTVHGGSQYTAHLTAHNRNQCKICGDHFATRKHLETHTLSVHNTSVNKDLFRCHICDRTFAQRRSLVYHYKITHPDNTLVCSVCLEMFNSSTEMEAHQATHRQQLFICDKCNEPFTRKQQYLVHIKEHERYKCMTCSEGFSAKKMAMKHANQGHQVSGLGAQLQCATCGDMFCSRALLKRHMVQHSGGGIIACEKCKVTFKHERNYKCHLETMQHLRGEEPKNLLACKECNKTFTCKNYLNIHISRMHKDDLKEHACTHCPYKTTVPNNLKRHIALHTEKPRFICDQCGAQFQMKSALQEHHVRLHADRKDFSCDKCGRMFGRASDLNRHLQNTHSDLPLYGCHCGNNYKTLSSLKRHQLLNHGKVEAKQKRLKKLFPLEIDDHSKKKVKKQKTKKKSSSTDTDALKLLNSRSTTIHSVMTDANTQELLEVPYKKPKVKTDLSPADTDAIQLMNSQMTAVPSSMTERHPQELLEVPYKNLKAKTDLISNNADTLRALNSQMTSTPPAITDTSTVTIMTEQHSQEILDGSYKKAEEKTDPNSTNTDSLQLLNSQMPTMSSALAETNTVIMMSERHPQELLEVSYSMDFTGDNKSHVVYAENLDMGGLHVVESMIQLENDPTKQGASVLINVRNLFGRSLTNDFIMPSTIESALVSGLEDSLTDATQHVAVTSQKQDVITGLQDYIIPHDLNFLNV